MSQREVHLSLPHLSSTSQLPSGQDFLKLSAMHSDIIHIKFTALHPYKKIKLPRYELNRSCSQLLMSESTPLQNT